MKNLIYKELKMATPLLTFLFLGFTLMTFIPGYPILCGAFFVSFGFFQGYQYSREAGDLAYSILLPVRKRDIVKAKYLTVCLVQMTAFVLFAIFTWIRMKFLASADVYVQNPMMNANIVFLGYVLIVFAIFNSVFLGGFFKTGYNIGKPFIIFIITCFLFISVAEVLHHLPGMEWLNVPGKDNIEIQMCVLILGTLIYITVYFASCKISQKNFEKIDL